MEEATALRFYQSIEPYKARRGWSGGTKIKVATTGQLRPSVPVLQGTPKSTIKRAIRSPPGLLAALSGTSAASSSTYVALPEAPSALTSTKRQAVPTKLKTSTSLKESCPGSQERPAIYSKGLQFILDKFSRRSERVEQHPLPQACSPLSTTPALEKDGLQYLSSSASTTSGYSSETEATPDQQSPQQTPYVLSTPRAPLIQLPDELLLRSMRHLGTKDLYMLRQASSVFARLFGDKLFARYHESNSTRQRLQPFAVDCVSNHQRQAIASLIQKDNNCQECFEARYSSNWAVKLAALRAMLYCDGCQEKHPRFLFFPEDIEKSQRSGAKLVCVGRRAYISLCSHGTPKTRAGWPTLTLCTSDDSVCTHPSHQPGSSKYREFTDLALPQMELSHQSLAYWWDLPLLDIDQTNTPTLGKVHEALSELLEEALCSHKVCKHLMQNGHLRNFISSGICDCFVRPGHYVPSHNNEAPDCFCGHQRYLTCVDCGAACTWYLRKGGRLGLSYRYFWKTEKPTCAAWLSFLDENSYKDRLFREDTRNIFWCDRPQCSVANGRRWESMIKQNMVKEGSSMYSLGYDLGSARERAEATGYRMP